VAAAVAFAQTTDADCAEPAALRRTSDTIAGRTGEMATLNSFVDSSAPFSWMVVDGPAGSGKSRLVQEFCLALAPSWRAGFLLPVQRFEAWSSWQSEANTVVAIDYAAERIDESRMILLALAARADQQRGHFRARVLLVERDARGDWMDRLIGSRSDGYAIEAARFSESPLTLGPLSDQELWSSVRSLMQGAGKQPPAVEALLDRLREIDPLRRPLFAILAADALIAGRDVREWDRERLMRDVLARERERWGKMGVTLYKLPDIFQGENMFAWVPVLEDLRRLRLLLVESDLALIYPLMRAQRLREADHLLEETHDLWWRHNRQDREFANAWSGAIMRHADASAASGNYEQVPKAIAVLQEIARNFPEERAFQTYSSRLSRGAQQGRGSQRRRQLYESGAPVLPRWRGARKSLLRNSRLTPARPGA
jgi:hypothetical protein